jgi:hypothetical protein
MQRNGIRWDRVFWEGRMPCDLLRLRNQVEAGSGQGGHVQRLANVASRLRPICMVVEKRTARGKIEQRYATQNCQRAPLILTSEDRLLRVHTLTRLSVPA